MQVASNRLDREPIVDHLLDLLACFPKCSWVRNNAYWLRRRMRKNGLPPPIDEEVITLYLYGVIESHRNLQTIHRYANKHLKQRFPHLPRYKAFDHRMNQFHDIFVPFAQLLCDELLCTDNTQQLTGLTDSMPIIMAQRGRRFHAKVAPEIATKNGYCATKKLHYYGVKLHVVANLIKGSLPIPVCLGLTDAGMHDRKTFE